jgi:hypothetical protein
MGPTIKYLRAREEMDSNKTSQVSEPQDRGDQIQDARHILQDPCLSLICASDRYKLRHLRRDASISNIH